MASSAQFQIRIGVNSSGVKRGIDAATSEVQKLTKQFNTLKNTIVGSFVVNQAKQIIDWGSSISNAAKKAGIGAEEFQAWTYAAKASGVEMDQLSSAFQNLQKAQIEALNGDEKLVNSFARIGLSIADLKKLTPTQLFESVGQALASLPNSAQTTVDALNLMGKTGTDMLRAFRDGFFDAAKAAHELGLVLSSEVIAELDRAGNAVDRLGLRFKVALAPGVTWLVNQLENIADLANILWVSAFKPMAQMLTGTSFSDAQSEATKAVDKIIDGYAERMKKKAPELPSVVAPTGKSDSERKAEEKAKEEARKKSQKERADAERDSIKSALEEAKRARESVIRLYDDPKLQLTANQQIGARVAYQPLNTTNSILKQIERNTARALKAARSNPGGEMIGETWFRTATEY